jgi:hypothetical protein
LRFGSSKTLNMLAPIGCFGQNRLPSVDLVGAETMLRLSRALVIEELERLVEDSIGRIGRHEWSLRGVDCRRERHSHSAPAYSFDLDILNVRAKGGRDGRWELFIISEFWRSADGASMHSLKWLKLAVGKPADVLHWIKINRNTPVDEGARAAGTQPLIDRSRKPRPG